MKRCNLNDDFDLYEAADGWLVEYEDAAAEVAALRSRIAALEQQATEAEESAACASRAVAMLDAAVESSRERADQAEARAVRLSAALNGLLDAVNNLSDDAREEFGGPDDAPVRAAIDALGLVPNSGEEPTR